MNSEESSGSSSCNGQENGDGYSGSERPLKKARFAWQVKGKYHLKNENNDPAKISTTESTASEMAGPSGSESYASDISNIDMTTTEINKNLCTSDSVVDEPDKSVTRTSTGNLDCEDKPDSVSSPEATVFTDILNPQKSFSSQEHAESLALNSIESLIGRSQEKLAQCSILPFYNFHDWLESSEEECIRRWQFRQKERYDLDNSINRILETMHLQASEEISMAEGVNRIENEGILMAISAHGLQQPSPISENLEVIREVGVTPSSAIRICFRPLIDESDDESEEESQPCVNNVQWRLSNQPNNEDNETIPSPTFHGTSNLTLNYENLHNSEEASDDVEIENDNHHDFLDAAVSIAIQSKGLTTLGTDYG